MVKEVKQGKSWTDIFPGVASLQLSTSGTGISVDIRITKKEGESVHLVPEGTPGATVLAVKRVNELDYYSLGAMELAAKTGLTEPKLRAFVWKLGLKESEEYFKAVRIGKNEFKRYSPKALDQVKRALEEYEIDRVWEEYKSRQA